ncbi:hypothetical protein GCM10023317_57980 [Actinopolymorpha pittospori]
MRATAVSRSARSGSTAERRERVAAAWRASGLCHGAYEQEPRPGGEPAVGLRIPRGRSTRSIGQAASSRVRVGLTGIDHTCPRAGSLGANTITVAVESRTSPSSTPHRYADG